MFPSGTGATFAYFCSCEAAHKRKKFVPLSASSSSLPSLYISDSHLHCSGVFVCERERECVRAALHFHSGLRFLVARQEMLLYPQKWMQNKKMKIKRSSGRFLLFVHHYYPPTCYIVKWQRRCGSSNTRLMLIIRERECTSRAEQTATACTHFVKFVFFLLFSL